MTTVSVRYGANDLTVRIPADREVDVLEPPSPGDPRPVLDAVAPHLATLERAARDMRAVAVIVPDDSRPFPVSTVLPPVLEALTRAGVTDAGITILVATGLHRAMPEEALREHLGPDVTERHAVRNHDARDEATLRTCGSLPEGTPVAFAREAVEADLRVLLGSVEPHQYHGFSGGYKALGIGCAGEALVGHTHGRAYLTDERVRPGAGPGNPFRATISEAARRAGASVALNLIPGPDAATTYGAAAGEPDAVWAALADRAIRVFGSRLERAADVVLAGVPDPKSRSLYQASRAATNLVLCARPAVSPGGAIVLVAPCEDGVGTGAGERRFGESLREKGLEILGGDEAIRPGEQRAYMVARVLADHRLLVAGARDPGGLEGLGVELVESPEAALAALPGRVLAVPDALHVLPMG